MFKIWHNIHIFYLSNRFNTENVLQYTEGKEEINIIAVDPVSTDMVPGNTHKRRLLDVRDDSERVKKNHDI